MQMGIRVIPNSRRFFIKENEEGCQKPPNKLGSMQVFDTDTTTSCGRALNGSPFNRRCDSTPQSISCQAPVKTGGITRFKIYVTSEAEKGKANAELLKELGKALKRKVRIIKGLKNRKKVIEIEGEEKKVLEAIRVLCSS